MANEKKTADQSQKKKPTIPDSYVLSYFSKQGSKSF